MHTTHAQGYAFKRLLVIFLLEFLVLSNRRFSVNNNIEVEAHGGCYTNPKLNVLPCKKQILSQNLDQFIENEVDHFTGNIYRFQQDNFNSEIL